MDYLQFSVMKAGEVTAAIHELNVGDQIGVRAPLGNYFPYESMKGKKILFVGGGIGLAPLRTLILFMLDNRADYGDITIIYGARTHNDYCYKDELKEWGEGKDVELILTVDANSPGAPIREGFVPTVLNEVAPKPDRHHRHHLRPAHHDQVRAPEPREARLRGERDHHDPGSQDEVRHRAVRQVQHREPFHMQGRSGVYAGSVEGARFRGPA